MTPPAKKKLWKDKLTRSGYFVGALLFHLVLFVMVATWVVFQAPPQPDNTPPIIPPAPVAHNNPPPKTPTDLTDVPKVDSNEVTTISVISTAASSLHIAIDIPFDSTTGPKIVAPTPRAKFVPGGKGISPERLKKIYDSVTRYRSPNEFPDHDPSATFPVYIATYANGDWDCNIHRDQNGDIVAGSIPDLAAKIAEWSHGQVKAMIAPKPLDVGGNELLDKMPPFIFFTGHKDFVLTDQEVANLSEYLDKGGMIWGDNALAGKGSRFDVAFRREMKRVVPDLDKNFEPLAMDDDLFTKGRFSISKIPQGMNCYAEPVEHLDIDGVLAILYTPNDYSDMMDMRILPGDATQQLPYRDMPPKTLYTEQEFWYRQHAFYRNFTVQSSLDVHHLGMNIVTYLLTRFDDKLLLSP